MSYNDGLWQTCSDSGCSFLTGISGTLNGSISNIDENTENDEQELKERLLVLKIKRKYSNTLTKFYSKNSLKDLPY